MITKYIKKDITQTDLVNLAHGVNCRNKMGSGVAKSIYEAFPEVKSLYHIFCAEFQHGNQKELLGEIQAVKCNGKVIYNCFTQLNYGYDGEKYLSYTALVDCFKTLTKELEGSKLAIPKIGGGLAGGNWELIELLINEITEDKLEVWVYEL